MQNFVFYSHINSGNRGCEAIVRSTIPLLNTPKKDISIITEDIELDTQCGLSDCSNLIATKPIKGIAGIPSIFPRAITKLGINPKANVLYRYGHALKTINQDTVALSTGGDLYCYPDYQWLSFLSDIVKDRKAKNVLWGCTVDFSKNDAKLKSALNKYDLITARDSTTYENLRRNNISSQIAYIPDTAFLLTTQEWDCSKYLKDGPCIGINVSNFVVGNTSFIESIKKLISYCLNETNYSIVLIPHVFWGLQNDVQEAKKIKTLFPNEERVKVACEFLNCCELKYLISQCEYYMGARTHTMIAAYSSFVPSIAFGYSIKSKSIATDLSIDDCYIIDTSKEIHPNQLLTSFEQLRKSSMKNGLKEVIPEIQNKIRTEALIINEI